MTREEMVSELRSSNCKVTFTKVNGDLRVMECTLNSDSIPPAPTPNIAPQKEKAARTDKVLAVYDVVAEDWRSFRVDNVTEFSTMLPE